MPTLAALKALASVVSMHLGNSSSVIIRDFTETSASDRNYIADGTAPLTGAYASLLNDSELFPVFSENGTYSDIPITFRQTHEGRTIKASVTYIKGSEGLTDYAFIILNDITELLMAEAVLHNLTDPISVHDSPTAESTDVSSFLDELISESVKLTGKPVAMMSKSEKTLAIRFLKEHGAFLITGSGDRISNYFGISKYTLYSYLDADKQ